jgi:hypothetical protein
MKSLLMIGFMLFVVSRPESRPKQDEVPFCLGRT